MSSLYELDNWGWKSFDGWDTRNPSNFVRACNYSKVLQEGKQRQIHRELARETERQSDECIDGWAHLAFFLKCNFS